jgi:hypothetical protein
MGMGVGALSDALIHRFRVVFYRRSGHALEVTITPQFVRGARAVQAAIAF